ncbi:MAG: hypothetical protein HRU12_14285 [Phaeodactylibacter sp.]|nr:hypothetical protein [Phaeodactylibacter sp.]
MIRTGLVCFVILFSLSLGVAQKGQRYTADFTFERGIYPTLEDWKAQTPVKPSDIIVDIDPQNRKFFQYLFARDQFRFPRNNEMVYLKPEEIFGYSPDTEAMYYKTNYKFEIIGAICVLSEVDQVDSYSSFINPGAEYQAARKEGKGKRYILRFDTGEFFRCKAGKVEEILRQDPELFNAYKAASGKKSEKINAFIKEYNYKHPVYFGR